jgi:hypothetical protein
VFDPTIGRWQTKDPKSFDAGDTNLYRYVGNHPTMATDPSGLFEEGIKKPGEQWRIFNIFASNPDQAKYVVRKVGGDGPPYASEVVKNGIKSTGPSIELHPVEHVLNQHLGGQSPYSRASTLRNGAPKIRGTPVWEDISKLEDGQLLTHEDIVKASKEFFTERTLA